MATRYFCDNCGDEEEIPIRIMGSEDFYVLCKSCWEQVKEKLVIKKEASDVNQR
jgi:uncharacterized Zn finger protein